MKLCNRISILGILILLKILISLKEHELAVLVSIFLFAFIFQEVLFWQDEKE